LSAARLRLLGGLLLALLVGGSPGSAAAAAAAPLPVMAVVPTCGRAGTAQVSTVVVPYTIEVIGRNLGIYGVSIVFNPGPAHRLSSAQPDQNGSLDQVIHVAPVPQGTYTIQVQDLDYVPMASTLFVVPCPTPTPVSPSPPAVSPSAPPRVLNPTLTLSPAVGPPGTIVTARGADFPASTSVQVSWSQGIGGTTAAPITTDPSGGFTTTVLVLPHDALGTRVLTAVSVTPPKSSLFGFASASFLVVPGEVQPSDFSWRR
jgi:hypothetical protein